MAVGHPSCAPAPPACLSRSEAPTAGCLDAVVGLGSNLGDRVGHLHRALLVLARDSRLAGVSALYCTEPVGGPRQREFLNAAVRLFFDGSPAHLMSRLLKVEGLAGRQRDAEVQWGPRPLDLDILWIDGLWLREPSLSVPHPRLDQRAFALWPLLDVAPHAAHPRSGQPYARIAKALGRSGIRARLADWLGPSRHACRAARRAVDKAR